MKSVDSSQYRQIFLTLTVFGRPFVKRLVLCYRSVVLCVLSCLSVCDIRALWPNGWTDQDETWHAGRPRPWPHCVRWGPSFPSRKGAQPLPIFGPYLLRPNGCMDQDVTWYVLDGDPAPPPQKGGPHIFGPSLLWPNG